MPSCHHGSQMPFMCIDLTGGSTNPGTLIEVWNCNGLKNQEWAWVGNALKYSADTSMCVAVQNGQQTVGSKLILDKCNGAASQQFGLDQNGRIYVAGAQKFCLSPVGDKFLPGTNIQLFTCAYYNEQQWTVATGKGPPPVPAPDFKKAVIITSEFAPGKCLDVPGGKATAAAVLDLWDCVGVSGQSFFFNADGTISSMVDKSMCLELTGGIKQGINLQLSKCSGANQQKFGYDHKTATIYASASASDASLCVDIPGKNAKNGQTMWVWGCNGLGQQQWYVQNTASALSELAIV